MRLQTMIGRALLGRAYDPGTGGDAGTGDGAGAAGDAGDSGTGTGEGAAGGDAGTGGTGDGAASLHDAAMAAISKLEAAGQEIPGELRKAVSELGRARKEAAEARVAAKTQDDTLKQALAKALGLDVGGGEKLTPEQLTEKLGQTQSEANRFRLELAFRDAAETVGADRVLSWAVLNADPEFVRGLDLSSATVGQTLEAKLRELVEKNPKLKAGTGAPSKSGTELAGGSQGSTFTREQLAKMTPEETEKNWQAIKDQMKAGTIR